MNGKTHIIGGMTAAMTLTTIGGLELFLRTGQDYTSLGVFLGASAVGALIPDIDHKNSTISSDAGIVSFIVRLFCKHRGFTHSLWFLSIFMFLSYNAITSSVSNLMITALLGISVGIGSHILLDFLNPKGVEMYWPYPKKIGLGIITTGTILETVFKYCLVIMFAYLVYIRIKFGIFKDFNFEVFFATLRCLKSDILSILSKIPLK